MCRLDKRSLSTRLASPAKANLRHRSAPSTRGKSPGLTARLRWRGFHLCGQSQGVVPSIANLHLDNIDTSAPCTGIHLPDCTHLDGIRTALSPDRTSGIRPPCEWTVGVTDDFLDLDALSPVNHDIWL
jgi:hypothetical protein